MADEPEFRPLCIWCSAPWDDKNVRLSVEGGYFYSSCREPGDPVLRIVCHSCGKLMYEKQGSYDDLDG